MSDESSAGAVTLLGLSLESRIRNLDDIVSQQNDRANLAKQLLLIEVLIPK